MNQNDIFKMIIIILPSKLKRKNLYLILQMKSLVLYKITYKLLKQKKKEIKYIYTYIYILLKSVVFESYKYF